MCITCLGFRFTVTFPYTTNSTFQCAHFSFSLSFSHARMSRFRFLLHSPSHEMRYARIKDIIVHPGVLQYYRRMIDYNGMLCFTSG
ncbi:Uncharacterized protein APZ42_001475 [Daphnia magna]|uniref:Uncharacterized protein n=1 Tax=Daphnia magna TaxID=35525 RepID=A0A0N7ZNH9_9CRUS|nr:Uncharacterized protein APZ42_001475 [Daphnia magna]